LGNFVHMSEADLAKEMKIQQARTDFILHLRQDALIKHSAILIDFVANNRKRFRNPHEPVEVEETTTIEDMFKRRRV
jgi:hypothetical protein